MLHANRSRMLPASPHSLSTFRAAFSSRGTSSRDGADRRFSRHRHQRRNSPPRLPRSTEAAGSSRSSSTNDLDRRPAGPHSCGHALNHFCYCGTGPVSPTGSAEVRHPGAKAYFRAREGPGVLARARRGRRRPDSVPRWCPAIERGLAPPRDSKRRQPAGECASAVRSPCAAAAKRSANTPRT